MVKPDETDPITHGCSHQGQTVDRQSRAVVSGAHRFRMRRPRGRPRELYDYSRRTRKFSIDPRNLFGVVDFLVIKFLVQPSINHMTRLGSGPATHPLAC